MATQQELILAALSRGPATKVALAAAAHCSLKAVAPIITRLRLEGWDIAVKRKPNGARYELLNPRGQAAPVSRGTNYAR